MWGWLVCRLLMSHDWYYSMQENGRYRRMECKTCGKIKMRVGGVWVPLMDWISMGCPK